jgi:hypothetical protein
MTKKFDHLEVVDTTGLTDADWAEINNLKKAYDAARRRGIVSSAASPC